MRHLVFLFLVLIVPSLVFAGFFVDGKIEEISLSTFTKAMCTQKRDSSECMEKLFVDCNGKVRGAEPGINCSGIEIYSKVSGYAIFDDKWTDPRINALQNQQG